MLGDRGPLSTSLDPAAAPGSSWPVTPSPSGGRREGAEWHLPALAAMPCRGVGWALEGRTPAQAPSPAGGTPPGVLLPHPPIQAGPRRGGPTQRASVSPCLQQLPRAHLGALRAGRLGSGAHRAVEPGSTSCVWLGLQSLTQNWGRGPRNPRVGPMPSTRSRTCRVPMVDSCWHLGSASPEPPGGGQEDAAPLTELASPSCRGLGEWSARDRPWAGPVPVVLSRPRLLGKASRWTFQSVDLASQCVGHTCTRKF